MASEVSMARETSVNPINAVISRTMAYDRSNAVSAVGKRAYSLMTNRRYGGRNFLRNYERISRAASNMQQRLRNS